MRGNNFIESQDGYGSDYSDAEYNAAYSESHVPSELMCVIRREWVACGRLAKNLRLNDIVISCWREPTHTDIGDDDTDDGDGSDVNSLTGNPRHVRISRHVRHARHARD